MTMKLNPRTIIESAITTIFILAVLVLTGLFDRPTIILLPVAIGIGIVMGLLSLVINKWRTR